MIPSIAIAWALSYFSNTLQNMYYQFENEIKLTNGKGNAKAFSLLDDLHALCAGGKAISSWMGE